MTLLRSALYQLILVAVVIPYSGLVLCTAPLPRLVRWRVIAGWPQFAFWLSRHLLRIDYDAGHGLASTKQQAYEERADVLAFLFW